MAEGFSEAAVAVATAITGVAIVAVIVSRNSQTAGVIQAGGSAFSNALAVAVSPVTGSGGTPVLSYPSSGAGFGNTSFQPSFSIPSGISV